jgi:hypothetical protein
MTTYNSINMTSEAMISQVKLRANCRIAISDRELSKQSKQAEAQARGSSASVQGEKAGAAGAAAKGHRIRKSDTERPNTHAGV